MDKNIPRISLQNVAKEIADRHLFGRVGSVPVARPKPVQQVAPDTRLNLALKGVLAYKPEKSALAIISSGSQQEKVYAIGDKIVGSTTLQAVYPDRVTIRRSGKNETLRLPDKRATLGVGRVQNTQTRRTREQQPGDLPTSAKALRERILKEPAVLTNLISIRKYKRNGRQIGFRIQPKQSPELLSNFGIQPGDVITSINGITLSDDRQGFLALGKLRRAKSADLIVLRSGAEIPVFVSLQ